MHLFYSFIMEFSPSLEPIDGVMEEEGVEDSIE